MTNERVTEADVDDLVARVAEATVAYINGDMRRYIALIKHADDYTLMPPTGGDTVHGFEGSDEWVAEMGRFFKGGEATLEVVQRYVSGDLVVLVVVERQHGDVGDYPRQEWSLRVTLVFRRDGEEWQLVHRHADALVHPITFDQLAVLARG
jgi:ketosteroid isomerase-like protein